MTLAAMLEQNAAATKKEPVKEAPARWAATWKARHAGEASVAWQQQGATGAGDAQRIDGAKLVPGDQQVTVTGLEAAVQAMIDRPNENNGFALSFANACEFFSTQSPFGRPRLVLEFEPKPAATGPDLAVVWIERSPATEGQEVTYTAKIRNVGTEATKGFAVNWSVGGKEGSALDVPQTLGPGQETTQTLKRTYHFEPTDHRIQPVGLRLTPTGPDAQAANNALEIQESGVAIEVVGPIEAAQQIQDAVKLFNDTLAAQSRFSFAREGALERIFVQRIVPTPSAQSADGRATWSPTDFLQALGFAAGLPDLRPTQFPVGERNKMASRGSMDLSPGIMGYGDSRYEGTVLGSINLPYEPYWSPMFEVQPLEATRLLAATDVAILNKGLDRQTRADAVLAKTPDTILLRALDLLGRPLPKMELSFFQSAAGAIPDDPPAFSVATDDKGSILLPKREGGLFGKLTANGGNGAFLVSASLNGVTEWSWLKEWQLVDSYSRSGPGVAVFDMRFDLPGAVVDKATDLALDRIVTDSAGSPAAKLAPLVDGKEGTSIDLGPKKGDWVEVDLGRDRTLAEIDVIAGASDGPQKFEIGIYATGQRAADATIWAREIDWGWTATNRRSLVGSVPLVTYRGQPLRVRFIRITNRSDRPAKIAGIRILPAKL